MNCPVPLFMYSRMMLESGKRSNRAIRQVFKLTPTSLLLLYSTGTVKAPPHPPLECDRRMTEIHILKPF
jgi:hypothetical protein